MAHLGTVWGVLVRQEEVGCGFRASESSRDEGGKGGSSVSTTVPLDRLLHGLDGRVPPVFSSEQPDSAGMPTVQTQPCFFCCSVGIAVVHVYHWRLCIYLCIYVCIWQHGLTEIKIKSSSLLQIYMRESRLQPPRRTLALRPSFLCL